ncbi:hypothetical protein RM704_06595 [Streptomyces sp. DSM 3412]|uniref:Uncharacterized protein n=1 Tax=Streptomyces gottesmaniae TaxID=3075518 RepID=A0ABU2YSB0_9ACTN|nr:hypothetical protein [Streptomyces sp. DSM 3412]MDT0567136.1 hypothetical protein [Streptomyces sp. DSM 3412]
MVHLERFTSDHYLEKPSDVGHYSVLHDHLQAQTLSPDSSRDFSTDVTKSYIDAASHPELVLPSKRGPETAIRKIVGPRGFRYGCQLVAVRWLK